MQVVFFCACNAILLVTAMNPQEQTEANYDVRVFHTVVFHISCDLFVHLTIARVRLYLSLTLVRLQAVHQWIRARVLDMIMLVMEIPKLHVRRSEQSLQYAIRMM